MSKCEVCIYELIGHSFGKIIHKTCREDTKCPFYKPKEEKGADDFARPHEVVANGNCAIRGKLLRGDRVFICEECSKERSRRWRITDHSI